MKGESTMDVISELDTLCIVAREVYGDRGVVLATIDPWWCVAGPADEAVELPTREMSYPGPLQLEAAKVSFPFDELFAHDVEPSVDWEA
jgi:hypothetical protein